ncbi:MAG: hypothetical protein GX907_03535 [Clostridiaceae bacterium]|nr:hypothetical protein [Clostridiaceae bacterium]
MKRTSIIKIVTVILATVMVISTLTLTGCAQSANGNSNPSASGQQPSPTKAKPNPGIRYSDIPIVNNRVKLVKNDIVGDGLFLPESWIEDYKKNGVSQFDWYEFLIYPYLKAHNLSKNKAAPGGYLVVPLLRADEAIVEDGSWAISPESQAELDAGKKPDSITIYWCMRVSTSEERWGKLVNAKDKNPKGDWLRYEFTVNSHLEYGEPLAIEINSSLGRSVCYGRSNMGSMFILYLP